MAVRRQQGISSTSLCAARRLLGAIALATLATSSHGCAGDFDTKRAAPARGSLGREMYTLVCDRVGAQALREDITGASYHAACHTGPDGAFASVTVDRALLPPLDPAALDTAGRPVSLAAQEANRAHRIARIEALSRRRDDLIGAFDAALADEPLAARDLGNPNPAESCGPPSRADARETNLRTELASTIGRLTDLYHDETIPHLTRALSRVMDDIERTPEAQAALARFDARRGYRPAALSVGVARPALAYPRIVPLAKALLRLLSADTDPLGLAAPTAKKARERSASERVPGKAHAAAVELLAALREELRTAEASPPAAPLVRRTDVDDPSLVRLSRPRGSLEIARTLLLHEDPDFSNGEPIWALRRDARGVAAVTLANGEVPPPFVDLTGPDGTPDGLPDIDELGQFVPAKGAVVPSPFPDVLVSAPGVTRDAAGRALSGAKPIYEHLDVSRTFVAALARDLVPLLDPDPENGRETLMDLVGGFAVVAGAREDKAKSARKYGEGKTATTVRYRAFRSDASPLLDLVHAFGQVLAAPQTEDTLALVQQLAEKKPALLARLLGVGLEVKAVADAHPEARIPAGSTLWDELLDVLVTMAQRPKLIEDILRAIGDDATPGLTRSAIAYLSMRDELTYNRNDLNGPAFNVTTGKVESLKTPVDRAVPDTGSNRSAFQRFLQALHDTNGMSVCTKPGAVAHIVWQGVGIDFPGFTAKTACFVLGADPPADPSPMCGLLRIKNVAEELVNAVLGEVKLDIRDECLRVLVDSPLTGIVGGADAFLEEISGIDGFNTKPTVPGLNRLVFFELPHDGSPGDTKNPKTLNFLKDAFDPAPTLVCPPLPFTDKDGAQLNLRQCTTFADSLRGRDNNALFPIEQLGFIEAAKPLARAFQQNGANLLFVDLFDTLHRHWGSAAQSTEECDPSAPKTNARWCSQDGAVTYEPLIAEALGTDLFPALHDAVNELATMQIAHCEERSTSGVCTKRSSWDGVKVLAEAIKSLVDPARNKGLTRRSGESSVVRNDGTKNAQVTPIYLLIDALKGFDQRFAEHMAKAPEDDRLPAWRRGRSRLVDQLFDVEGNGGSARLANPAVEKMLPVLVATLRSQLTAHCPDPRKTCDWAKTDLTANVTKTVTGPTFAGVLDTLDAIRSEPRARTELERLLVYLLDEAEKNTATTLTAVSDLLYLLEDDANITALLHGIADAAGPEVVGEDDHVVARGLLLASIEVLARVLGEAHLDNDDTRDRLCSKEIDPNGTFAIVLRKLVTPPADGKPAPIEVLIDVTADVNRANPELTSKLEPDDYGSIAREVSDFCAHPSRGLEQVYTVIKQATKDL